MNIKHNLVILFACCVFAACSPKVSTHATKKYPALGYRDEVLVIGLTEFIPDESQEVGTIKIGDTGFTAKCSWEFVLETAKVEARKMGGNAIKITEHILPSVLGSTCHRIKATVLIVHDQTLLVEDADIDSTLLNEGAALVHVYRNGGMGALVSYDLHLGDTVICRVTNSFKKTIKIKERGATTLWAKTEAKEEVPITLKAGRVYYVRCGLTMGAFVGHPSIDLVDGDTGKSEYDAIARAKSKKTDIVLMKNGEKIKCIINREDAENLYCTVIRNNRTTDTKINKSQIESIKQSE